MALAYAEQRGAPTQDSRGKIQEAAQSAASRGRVGRGVPSLRTVGVGAGVRVLPGQGCLIHRARSAVRNRVPVKPVRTNARTVQVVVEFNPVLLAVVDVVVHDFRPHGRRLDAIGPPAERHIVDLVALDPDVGVDPGAEGQVRGLKADPGLVVLGGGARGDVVHPVAANGDVGAARLEVDPLGMAGVVDVVALDPHVFHGLKRRLAHADVDALAPLVAIMARVVDSAVADVDVVRGAAQVDGLLARVVDLQIEEEAVIDAGAVERLVAVLQRQSVEHEVAGIAEEAQVAGVVFSQDERPGAGGGLDDQRSGGSEMPVGDAKAAIGAGGEEQDVAAGRAVDFRLQIIARGHGDRGRPGHGGREKERGENAAIQEGRRKIQEGTLARLRRDLRLKKEE